MGVNTDKIRADFPLLTKKNPPIYFDNACMTLRPVQVIQKINEYYTEYPACAGRSVHSLSRRVDEEVYAARNTIKKFIGANKDKEIIFQKNTTEGINLVANTFHFKKGDVILISDKEHNSNLLPWQVIAQKKGVQLKIVESNPDNTFSLDNFKEKLEQGNVALSAFGMSANLDGTSIPAKEIIALAHKAGSKVLLDAAQTVPHEEVDVKSLKVDFLAFSGHKMLGPSGIGVLYGREEALNNLDNFLVGGETAEDSWYDKVKWEGLPHKFEAGLQHYAGITGLGAAAKYLDKIGLAQIRKHELELNKSLTDGLKTIPGFSLIGPEDPRLRGGIVSFTIKDMSPHDIATMVSVSRQVMIRSGAHCVHSWFNKHQHLGSARASVYLYNTLDEVETAVSAIRDVARLRK